MKAGLILAFVTVAAGVHDPAPLELPPDLASYRSWLAGEVHAMSTAADALCRALSPLEQAQRRRELERNQGPHAERYLRVYGNAKASSVTPEATTFPVGSVIVKEKLRSAEGAAPPYGIAVMIKHAESERPLSAGWEFRFYPAQPAASLQGCLDCHRQGGTRDYVFTHVPLK